MADATVTVQDRHRHLERLLADMGSVVLGLSGGVDSSLLARVAVDTLGPRAVAVIAKSPSLPQRELDLALDVARQIGITHVVVDTDEVDDPAYAANAPDRCFHCKDELFTHLARIAEDRALDWIAYGENVDDDGDHRPGRRAARRHGVRAPLREAGFNKEDVRALARALDVPVWDKPAFACLASRFPPGEPITREALAQVEAAEDALWRLGIRQFRVRHHGDLARIEVEPADLEAVVRARGDVVATLQRLGYRHVTLDLAGYRTGSTSLPSRGLPVVDVGH